MCQSLPAYKTEAVNRQDEKRPAFICEKSKKFKIQDF